MGGVISEDSSTTQVLLKRLYNVSGRVSQTPNSDECSFTFDDKAGNNYLSKSIEICVSNSIGKPDWIRGR